MDCSVPTELGDLHDLYESGEFEILHPDGQPYDLAEWPLIRTIRPGEVIRGEEMVHFLADGTRLTLRCDSSAIYDNEGSMEP